jgi:hypothetical protein
MQECSLQLSLSVQECRPVTPEDAGMILLSMGEGILTHLPSVSRPNTAICLNTAVLNREIEKTYKKSTIFS